MKTFVYFSSSEKTIFPENLGWLMRNLKNLEKIILSDCQCSPCIRSRHETGMPSHAFAMYALGRMPRGRKGQIEGFRFGCSFTSQEVFDTLLRSRLSRYADIFDERKG